MRRIPVLQLTALVLLVFATGCMSENKGKIEGTRWRSIAATIQSKGPVGRSVRVPDGFIELHFHKDGSLFYIIRGKLHSGRYSLGMGHNVTLHLDEPVANLKTHTETVVIKGEILTMTDSDGTELSFKKEN